MELSVLIPICIAVLGGVAGLAFKYFDTFIKFKPKIYLTFFLLFIFCLGWEACCLVNNINHSTIILQFLSMSLGFIVWTFIMYHLSDYTFNKPEKVEHEW